MTAETLTLTTEEDHRIEVPEAPLSAAEALGEILDRVRSIDGKLDEIIEFVNAAGDQINEALSSGLGELVGGLFGGSEHGDT